MAEIKTLLCDIETFSSENLSKCGAYRYSEATDFEIQLFGYCVNDGPVTVIDLASGEKISHEIIAAIKNPNVTKYAHNSSFERICLSRYLGLPVGEYLDPKSWKCTMIWAAYMGLPFSLEGVGAVLALNKQKLKEGTNLIKYFCSQCAPTTSNGGRTRNMPEHDLEKWEMFKVYNIRDVETELAIKLRLEKFPVPDFVWDEYHLSEEINDRGVKVDMALVQQAINMDVRSRAELTAAMKKLTNIDNPNSVQQMKNWLADNGVETDTLGKKVVAELLKTAPEILGRALSLRQQLAKSSVKKYQAMEKTVCADGCIRGMFFFYGANRTGRFSSKYVQLQNLPQNHLPDLEQARALVRIGDFTALELLYDSVPEVLSELIRTAFIPKPGSKFVVADFSAIEARVIAWLAGERWRNEVFASHGKIYEASASRMFHVPMEEVTKGSPLRQKGKIAELALGYGGSVGALKAMGALEMGLTEEELKPLVTAWRSANPNIVRLWWDVDKAAMTAVRDRTVTETQGIRFGLQSGILCITLPSGGGLPM